MQDRQNIAEFLYSLSQANERARAQQFDPENVADRVVRWLLNNDVLRPAEIKPVYRSWFAQFDTDQPRERLWRMLANAIPHKAEEIRHAAARVYAFAEANVSIPDAIELCQQQFDNWSVHDWETLIALECLPIASMTVGHSARTRFVFASPDPTRPAIQPLLRSLALEGFELRYAASATVAFLADKVRIIIDANQNASNSIFSGLDVIDPQQAA